eukprot:4763180-Pyramimonas_sp.AAC.1
MGSRRVADADRVQRARRQQRQRRTRPGGGLTGGLPAVPGAQWPWQDDAPRGPWEPCSGSGREC